MCRPLKPFPPNEKCFVLHTGTWNQLESIAKDLSHQELSNEYKQIFVAQF